MIAARLWRPSAALTPVAALGVAFLAQYLFTGEAFTRFKDVHTWDWTPQFTVGTALLVLAIVVARLHAGRAALGNESSVAALSRGHAVSFPVAPVVASLSLYALTLGLYLVGGETSLVRAAWVGSVLALAGPLALRSAPRWSSASLRASIERRHVGLCLAVGALTLVSFVLRTWELVDVPSHVDNDIALMGVHALRLIETNNFNWVGASTSGHLLAYDQFLAWSMRLFGQDHRGLVLHSAILGTLTIPVLFLLAQSMFGSRVGLIAAGLLCVCYTHIQFSRILFGASSTFLATLVALLLYRGLRDGSALFLTLAGVASGLSLFVYDSARVIPVVVFVVFLVHLVKTARRGTIRTSLPGWSLVFVGALLTFGPLLAFAGTDFAAFSGRGKEVALWTPAIWEHQQSVYQTTSAPVVVLQQVLHTFLTLHLFGDGSPHFSFPRPMVAATTAAFFVVGLGSCLRRPGDLKSLLPVAWVLLTFVFGGVLTYDPPYWPHLNIALPAIAVIAAVGADVLIRALAPIPGTIRRGAMLAAVTATVAFTGVTNWQAYHTFVMDNAGTRIRIARYVDELPVGYTVYLVGEPRAGEFAFQFFNRGVPFVNLDPDTVPDSLAQVRAPSTFIVVAHDDALAQLEARFPSAAVETHTDAANKKVFVSIEVDPAAYAPPAQRVLSG